MHDSSQHEPSRSPHVLDLASQFSSLEGEVTSKIQTVRGAVAPVLQTSDVQLHPATQLAEKRIAAAEQAVETSTPPSFQPFVAHYFGVEIRVENPMQARKVRRRERSNERKLRMNPTVLLRDFSGKPDPRLTNERYAEAIRTRV